jgi:hypothetical protein
MQNNVETKLFPNDYLTNICNFICEISVGICINHTYYEWY